MDHPSPYPWPWKTRLDLGVQRRTEGQSNRVTEATFPADHPGLEPKLFGRPPTSLELRAWIRILSFVVATALLSGTALANPVLDWSALMLDAIRNDNTSPTLSSRNLAMLNAATYDAVNSITRTHQPYLTLAETSAEVSVEAAVIAAGRETMLALYPSFRPRTEDLFETQRSALPATGAVTNGLALGREVALKIIVARSADGANTDVPYIPSAAPGQWRRTPPFFRPPLTPQWRYVRPFCLPYLGPFLPVPPPALDSPEYAATVKEVRRLGGKQSADRTPEQSQIAIFWSDFSYTAMPPGHWHEIAATIARERNLSVPECARLFALLGLAQADAAIVCWEAKYRWNLWRPVTAIQRADEDGNPLTEADPTWDHFLVSPPFPAYTSGHSSFSKASSQVLTQFLGTDAVTFTARSDSLPGVFRTFTSLAACAEEVGLSRIYGGIHYPIDNEEGKRTGGLVGDYVCENFLLPNASLPELRFAGVTNGVPLLRVHGRWGKPTMVEYSPDLTHWKRLATNTAVPGGFAVSGVSTMGGDPGYYRVCE